MKMHKRVAAHKLFCIISSLKGNKCYSAQSSAFKDRQIPGIKLGNYAAGGEREEGWVRNIEVYVKVC
jgi:hypothetical protein